MNASLLALLALLVENAPKITADAVKTYADIAHGEGGLGKVQTALADLSKTVSDAVAAQQAA
ncbi:MAG TPA: hypothetical protein VGF92_05465 [Stellaceae bacterium]|jgi:hypothetical protein